MAKNSQDKVLIVGPSWVGDMVMSQALYKALKETNPLTNISVLARSTLRPLLERMPEVDEILNSDFAHGELRLSERKQLGMNLQAGNFNRAFILPLSFKSALIPWHAKIPNRIGWRGEWRNILLTDCRKLDKKAYPLMVQRFIGLAYPESTQPPDDLFFPKLLPKEPNEEFKYSRTNLSRKKNVLAICPGAEFGKSKQWPAAYFAEVATRVLRKGWGVWIFGSSNDRSVADLILGNIGEEFRDSYIDLVGKTDLSEAIDLLSLVSVVLSNDSGLMHVAAALGKNVIGLYGSTSPDFTPPLSNSKKLISTDIECRPCFERECRFGHLRCLTEIKPERVLDAITSFGQDVN